MKVVILAGGLGTRILEESATKPKPMVEIGGRPILWHIMKLYAAHGLTDFVVCLGYKGYVIKEYFTNYFLHHSDVTIDAARNQVSYHNTTAEPWRITLVDTGGQTLTGGRLLRVGHLLGDGPFCFTYGDGLSNIDITDLIAFHRAHGRLVTLSAVIPPGRYGALDLDGDRVTQFVEKPPGDQGYINGGFFVVERGALDVIIGDASSWEVESLPRLAASDHLRAFRHAGFWHAMDTLRDRNHLEHLWESDSAPWKVWR